MATEPENEERRLLASVADRNLATGLATIRQAVEGIWSPDAPRIIKDFTDHGIAHCERLSAYACKLLEAHKGPAMSSKERYLLCAAIYLHDIGMQCDVMKRPDIRVEAERLSAKFTVSFTAGGSSNFSVDEQQDIRRNHQFLSAAWLAYARSKGDTVLADVSRGIPDDLFEDLMTIIMHHSKLLILECPENGKIEHGIRVQFIAAVLRFADELDIDANRVQIDVVRNFRLEPHNAVYWYIHNATRIEFVEPNQIRIDIVLRPEEAAEFGQLLEDLVIREFERKNQPVLKALVAAQLPIVISEKSGVISYRWCKTVLPPEVVAWLHQIAKQERGPQGARKQSVRVVAPENIFPRTDARVGEPQPERAAPEVDVERARPAGAMPWASRLRKLWGSNCITGFFRGGQPMVRGCVGVAGSGERIELDLAISWESSHTLLLDQDFLSALWLCAVSLNLPLGRARSADELMSWLHDSTDLAERSGRCCYSGGGYAEVFRLRYAHLRLADVGEAGPRAGGAGFPVQGLFTPSFMGSSAARVLHAAEGLFAPGSMGPPAVPKRHPSLLGADILGTMKKVIVSSSARKVRLCL